MSLSKSTQQLVASYLRPHALNQLWKAPMPTHGSAIFGQTCKYRKIRPVFQRSCSTLFAMTRVFHTKAGPASLKKRLWKTCWGFLWTKEDAGCRYISLTHFPAGLGLGLSPESEKTKLSSSLKTLTSMSTLKNRHIYRLKLQFCDAVTHMTLFSLSLFLILLELVPWACLI